MAVQKFKRTRKMALTEGILAGVFFGTAAIFIRFLGSVNIFSIAIWRLIIASVALASILLFLERSFSFKLMRENFRDLLILGFLLGLHFIFFTSSVKDTTILNATVLVNTTPIFSMIVSTFIFNVKPSRLALAGLTLSFIGVCLITFAETTPTGFSIHLKGDVEAVLAAIVESFYLNFGRKTRGRMPILPAMLPIYVLAALIIGVIAVPAGHVPIVPSTINLILPMFCLGLLPTALAHTLYFSSLSNLKSFETATLALLEPIIATSLGAIIFFEVPAPLFILGAFLVLSGIIFVTKKD